MSAIIQKLNELSKVTFTLPISNNSVTINKINLELQSKFEKFATSSDNELQASIDYLEFINRHIRKEIDGDVEFLDKLYILLQWHNDIKDEKIDHAFTPVTIENLELSINGAPFVFEFELPSLVKDLAFLKFVSQKKTDIKSIDILFYFTCRFLKTVQIDGDKLDVSDIPLTQTLFQHLDINKVTSINKHIDQALEGIKTIRDLEVDARVFFA